MGENCLIPVAHPFPSLTGKDIKLIATCAMVVDHFSKTVFSDAIWLLWNNGIISSALYDTCNGIKFNVLFPIGHMAFPLFCFLLVEAYCNTHSKRKYILSLLLFAFISEPFFDLCFFGSLLSQSGQVPFFFPSYQNVFFTLFLGAFTLAELEQIKKMSWFRQKYLSSIAQIGCVLCSSLIAILIRSDYSAYGLFLIAGLYLFSSKRIFQVLVILIVSILFENKQPSLFTLLLCIVVLLYNGKRGKICHKYFYYIFYPAHLLLLYLASLLFVG